MTGGLEKATAALGGARATQGLDKGILSARQSSRLLAEELGIHLPRAVTSAIGEMLPAIGGLGGALLAAFAVREVYEFGEYVKSDSEAVEGLAQAEDRMKEAVKENLAEFKNFTREALQFELNATNLRIGAEERDFQHARRVAENEAALLPYVWHAFDWAFQTHIADNEKQTREMLDNDMALAKELTNLLEGKNEDAAAARAAKKKKDAEDAAREAYRKELEASKQDMDATNRSAEQAAKLFSDLYFSINEVDPAQKKFIENEQEIAKVTDGATRAMLDQMNWQEREKALAKELAETLKGLGDIKFQLPPLPTNFFLPMIEGTKQLTAAERLALPTEREIKVVREELTRLMPDLTQKEMQANAQRLASNPQIQKEIELLRQGKIAQEELNRAIAQEMGVKEQFLPVSKQFTEAIHAEITATHESMVAASEEATKGLAGFIGGRKAQAAVEAVWETARGIALLAEGSWPPNPAAIVAAGLHFEAAAQYAILAGSGGHHRGRGAAGGGGGGAQESSGPGGRQTVEQGGGEGTRGGGGSGNPQTIVQISGGQLNSNGQQQLAAWVGMGAAVGLYKFNASGSSGIPAPRY